MDREESIAWFAKSDLNYAEVWDMLGTDYTYKEKRAMCAEIQRRQRDRVDLQVKRRRMQEQQQQADREKLLAEQEAARRKLLESIDEEKYQRPKRSINLENLE